jgi:nitroreductase
VPSTASSTDASQEQQPQQPSPTDNSVGVEDAIKKAQEALAAAESSLGSIHKLRSAQPPGRWSALLQVAKSLATAAAAGALLVASHAFGLGWQWAGATIGALALAGERCQQYRPAQRRPHMSVGSYRLSSSFVSYMYWVGVWGVPCCSKQGSCA